MKKLCTSASLAVLLSLCGGYAIAQQAPAAGTKMSKADCQAIWSRADAAGSGALSSSQAQAYVTDFKAVDANADGKLSSAEFLNGCQRGLAHDSASSGAGAGTSGSGSSAVPPAKQY
jgi:hypothetical protein